MLKMMEGAVREIATFLESNMPAKVAALNAEYDDELALDEPKAYYLGEMSLESVQSYPCLFVLGRDTQISRYNANHTDSGHMIDIGVIIQQQRPENVQLLLYRSMRAIWELIIERFFSSTDDDFYTEDNAAIKFSPTFTNKADGMYYADALISARFGRDEDK